jgi:hypothetical protein
VESLRFTPSPKVQFASVIPRATWARVVMLSSSRESRCFFALLYSPVGNLVPLDTLVTCNPVGLGGPPAWPSCRSAKVVARVTSYDHLAMEGAITLPAIILMLSWYQVSVLKKATLTPSARLLYKDSGCVRMSVTNNSKRSCKCLFVWVLELSTDTVGYHISLTH